MKHHTYWPVADRSLKNNTKICSASEFNALRALGTHGLVSKKGDKQNKQ
jgi:hypothetical protein